MSYLCRWYREGVHEPIEAVRSVTDQGATSILTFTPKKEDDGAVFRCTVWNRAMAPNTKLEAMVNLNVNCKFNLSVKIQPSQHCFNTVFLISFNTTYIDINQY